MSKRAPPTENTHYEEACDQAIMMCGGKHARRHQGADHGE